MQQESEQATAVEGSSTICPTSRHPEQEIYNVETGNPVRWTALLSNHLLRVI